MSEMKRPYERPEVITYSASQVLAMLGPAKAVYGGGGTAISPESVIAGGGMQTSHVDSY